MTITVHNHTFEIDTNDWFCKEGAASCADCMAEWLEKQNPAYIKELHARTLLAIEGLIDWDDEIIEKAHMAAAGCASDVMKDYANTRNMTGHNCEFVAVK